MTPGFGFCYHSLMDNYAALEWQWQMGVTDFVGDMPCDWTHKPVQQAAPETPLAVSHVMPVATPLPVQRDIDLSNVNDLSSLRDAIQNYDGIQIKKTATQIVFGEGVARPRVVVIGEAPGADEDRLGVPFVGVAGKLLDKILASVGLSRETNSYITNVLNWRPPGNRQPTPQEIAMSLPFLQKHIELLQPEFLLIVGGTSAKALFNIEQGITRVRGKWMEYELSNGKKIPALITFHPAYLLRAPAQKALVWRDMLALKEKLG